MFVVDDLRGGGGAVRGRGACMAGRHAWQGSICGGGGACVAGGMHGRGYAWWGACVVGDACMAGACIWGGGVGCVVGETATAADGTHPTGMHSCC